MSKEKNRTVDEKNLESINSYAERLLLANGFEKLTINAFTNQKCSVMIHKPYYEIYQKGEGSYFTPDHLIYHLIGYLTYHDLIDRNYIKP